MSTTEIPTAGAVTVPAPPAAPLRAAVVVLGPVVLLASELVAVREPAGMSAAEDAAFMLEHSARLTASWGLGLLAAALLAAGFLHVAREVTDRARSGSVLTGGSRGGRGRLLAGTAAVLGVTGAIGLAGHMTQSLTVLDLLRDHPEAGDVAESAWSGWAALLTLPPTILGCNLAVLLLGLALWRAGWARGWVAVAGLGAVVADFSPTGYNSVLWALFAGVVMVVGARGVAGLPARA